MHENSMLTAQTSTVSPILVTVPVSDAPISDVTVFKSNRAEITRNINIIPDVTGIHEIKLPGLPETIDSDSIRVDGTGYCSILDVSYSEESDLSPEIVAQNNSRWSAREKELADELHELETRLDELGCEERRDQAAETYVKQYASTAVTSTKKEENDIATIDGVLSYTLKRLEIIDSNRTVLKRKITETQKKIDAIKSELFKVEQNFDAHTSSVRFVNLSIEVIELGPIDLSVRYVVRNASWSSSFDMRVTTTENSIKCIYYGQVRQSTGEDWDNVSLTLSTAAPSLSANPPSVDSKSVGWKISRPIYLASRIEPRMFRASSSRSSSAALSTGTIEQGSMPVREFAPSVQRREVAVDAGGSSMLGAISYPIDAPATISSKALPKKITIGALNLSAEFAHFAVPLKEDAAYLKAKVHNTTEYLLLASNDVSVFFDKRFVSKTNLRSVSPGEKFDLFLGVDKAIKVTYAPPRKMSKTRGLLTKSQYETHMLCSTITNSKDVPVTIAVIDVLPQSTDDLIKVTLENPRADAVGILNTDGSEESLVSSTMELIEGFEPPALPTFSIIKVARNESGKMVWIVYIAPKAVARIPFEFTMEWPSTREIEIN